MKKNILYIAMSAFLLASCASEDSTLDMVGMFSSNGEPVNVRFEQSIAYNDTALNGGMTVETGSDTYTVYVCTDSHVTRKAHKNLDYFIAQYNAAAAPKIALHLGDLIDAQNNFPCADSILALANGPLFITPGNHDVYFKQWPIYRSFFHTGTYWFDTYNTAGTNWICSSVWTARMVLWGPNRRNGCETCWRIVPKQAIAVSSSLRIRISGNSMLRRVIPPIWRSRRRMS